MGIALNEFLSWNKSLTSTGWPHKAGPAPSLIAFPTSHSLPQAIYLSSSVWLAITKISPTMRFVNNKRVCLIVLEAEKSQITVLTESVSGENQLPHGCLSFHW